MKKVLLLLTKFAISACLLFYLFHKIDMGKLKQAIHDSNIGLVVLCILLYGLGQVLSTFKWSLLIHSHGLKHPFNNLLSYYFIGMFFNQFLPSIVGGDIQRCYAVYRDEKNQSNRELPQGRLSQIISSVMMERVSGMVAMIWLANIAYFLYFRNLPIFTAEDPMITVYLPKFLLLLFIGTLLGFIIILISPSQSTFTISKQGFMSKAINSVKEIARQLSSYAKNRNLLIQVMILSFVFQSMMVIINAILGYSLGLDIPLSYYFVIIPLITICTALPISISGLGVRESAYVYFLSFAHINNSYAMLLSFSFVIIVAINNLMGGIILFKKGFPVEKNIAKIS